MPQLARVAGTYMSWVVETIQVLPRSHLRNTFRVAMKLHWLSFFAMSFEKGLRHRVNEFTMRHALQRLIYKNETRDSRAIMDHHSRDWVETMALFAPVFFSQL